MDAKQTATQNWLFERLEVRLAEVFEAMAGERPAVRSESLRNAGPPDQDARTWRQDFQGLQGSLWIAATKAASTALSQQVLHGAGIDDADQAMLDSTYTETFGQAISGVAQDCSGRVGHEVTCPPGDESSSPQTPPAWSRVVLSFQSGEVEIVVAIEDRLLDALALKDPEPAPSPQAAASKTFDLLLDVELPVSVSFGRAQVALKDVIKLTTGSIVELNRSIAEPVEVIVNNCVIARGEVVVVEGNFGVRIQEVISRQERLRTLN